MILPAEKTKGLISTTDGESREFPAPSDMAPRSLIPSDNAQPPSYSDSFATSASTLYSSGNVTYPSFQPMFLVATGKTLDKGFPYASPPSKLNPHPFVSHDINERDWISFLEEAQMAATLTQKQIGSSHLPIVSMVPGIGCAASYGVRRLMKYRNASKVVDCIDKWNKCFFEQRKIKIILMKGQAKVSGQNEYLNNTPTSSSSDLGSGYQKYYEDHPPSFHTTDTSISRELIGKNDNIYRLFIVSLT